MDQSSLITCPNCGTQFNTEQALAKEVENKLRAEFNLKFITLKEQESKKLESKELEIKKQLEEEKRKNEIELKERLQKEFEFRLKSNEEELEKKRKENSELKNKELELLKKERALLDEKQEYELRLQKQLLEERNKIEELARKKSDEENWLKIKEKDMLVEQLQKHIEEMKKKAEQGSMQMQGEVQEVALQEILQTAFPFDIISEVGKGVKGADIIQKVHNRSGVECGTIIYESKRTKNFAQEWIDKLKLDLRAQKSDIAILVTETMPKDMHHFGEKEGIWICTFNEIGAVAAVLRESLIKINSVRQSQENKGDKMHMLYEFLTGNEFKQHMEAIVEGFSNMQQGLLKERISMEKIWAEREKQIYKVLTNLSGMYGSIKGIAGNAVAEVKLLELDNNEV
ncbi:MAG: DUF2130 domain-containing protein [Bacteroidota bacterium]|nr:DUF2130 domain-containing protein [Bacteroidota bacterium]